MSGSSSKCHGGLCIVFIVEIVKYLVVEERDILSRVIDVNKRVSCGSGSEHGTHLLLKSGDFLYKFILVRNIVPRILIRFGFRKKSLTVFLSIS